MCGRLALVSDTPHLARLLHAGLDPELVDGLRPSWNVGPTSMILGVAEDGGHQRTMGLYRWGFVPAGGADPTATRAVFNARAETVATKPMFRVAFERRRILIPVDAFYEWKAGTPKQPFVFKRSDGEPVVFAGLRQSWTGHDGTELQTATIITTAAGPDMPIHDRQPVVLDRGAWGHWLDPEVTDPGELGPLLRPTPDGTLTHYRVGREVGNVDNDGPELIREIDPAEDGAAVAVPLPLAVPADGTPAASPEPRR
jgi:putative SOS response-associated peptidase YedK